MKQSEKDFSTTAEVMTKRQVKDTVKPMCYEFQYDGNYLAEKMNDQRHATLYDLAQLFSSSIIVICYTVILTTTTSRLPLLMM
ncbi:MAG: hypothetical protein RBT34_15060 [Anaerolineaceae bacterium]|jgi:hypothetical protein|nr:hypothetical protein [Anaerolineaceae bacterium]